MPKSIRHFEQQISHADITQELPDRHVAYARPEWQPQPAGQCTNWITNDWQPAKEHRFRAKMLEPRKPEALLFAVKRLFRGIAHRIIDNTTQRISNGGNDQHGPEQVEICFNNGKHRRF